MKQIFSREGWRALAGSWIVLGLSIVAAAVIIAASQWYRDREKRESDNMALRLQQARTRVESARHERDSLQESAVMFRALVDRGLLQSERRLDLVEMVNDLRSRHQLFSLEYDISPQRALTLSGGRAYPSVDVLSSRVRMRVRALHEGDVLGFMDDISRSRQGFYTVDRCRMRRLEATTPDLLVPHIEAECTLEWITLKEKNANNRPA
jgi:hypothetical protein